MEQQPKITKEFHYADTEKLSDEIHDFIIKNGYTLLNEYEFRTKLNELMYESIDKNWDNWYKT